MNRSIFKTEPARPKSSLPEIGEGRGGVPPLALLPLLLLLFATACGVDKDEYVAANNALIDQLPVFPGAQEVERQSSSYEYEEDLFGGPDGYTTTATFMVPDGTRASEVAEYFAAIPLPAGWDRILASHVYFCVDEAQLSVVVTSVEESGYPVYSVTSDYRALRGTVHTCPERSRSSWIPLPVE